ncbi:Cl-channel protein [Macrolepiota fuliginosa MF-IS2]|uniref:Chloride channel protein n=1 Tax=Macrolepiota fuliginosa MF-IS2 TaxID=1400762 RepID=A0A9P5XLA6_9AGAR|nr:Cl-channel protein [Macrolepiota fuliginosa MF-IS2]
MPSSSARRPSTHYDGEQYELTEEGRLLEPKQTYTAKYKDGASIDWSQEEMAEREHQQRLKSQAGVRGILSPAFEAACGWLVVILTGIGVGIAGAWLDVLVKWLGDLREGRCSYGFFYNQVACCSGIDPGEVCYEWQSWSTYYGFRSIFGASLLQSFVYVALAIIFAASAAVLVVTYAPYAFHTGIPEIKAILGGYVLDAFLSPWTLLIKALGLALAVASGLSLGKEGPLVHVSCCLAFLISRFFKQFQNNEASKRKLLAAAAAAGVSVAFGSPLGGVLFGLEELETFSNESEVMWKGFVASGIAAVALQWVNPFGTAKLVLFQVTFVNDTWRAFELVPWLSLGVIGGILGSLLIKLNVKVAIYRKNSIISDWPILEVVCISAATAAVSYLVVFARVQSSELVANLFQECDPAKGDYHGLCNPTASGQNIFLLLLTAAMKFFFTAWTFGMMVPAGIFLPTIAIGACLGRAVGLITQSMYRFYPTAWVFLSCPPDPSVRCISPGFYAVIGAAAMLGGVTRMTISLVVILFELTGALSHVLPIMIAVMTAKWVGDAQGIDGIYSVWIAMRRYPWLPPVDFKDTQAATGENIMKSADRLVKIEEGNVTVTDLEKMLARHGYSGFPVVNGQELVGYASRTKLQALLDALPRSPSSASKICSFLPPNRQTIFSSSPQSEHNTPNDTAIATPPSVNKTPSSNSLYSSPEIIDILETTAIPATSQPIENSNVEDIINFSSALDSTTLQLRKQVPRELIITMFQKMNLREVLFTEDGRLEGMLTKRDITRLLTSHFDHAAALCVSPSSG